MGTELDLGRLRWLAPALWVFYQPAAVYVSSTLLEITFSFVVLLLLVIITTRAELREARWGAVGVGLLVGMATLVGIIVNDSILLIDIIIKPL